MSALDDVALTRSLCRLPVIPLLHGRLATAAWSWDRRDQLTREWWPQGITWAGDLALVSWYARAGGSRICVVSLPARRYGHVTLVGPAGEPMRIHAGGIAWVDGWLYVAATARGWWTWHVDDLDPITSVWPARELHRPEPPTGGALRWSFLDAHGSSLIGGEYGRGTTSTRLFRVPISAGAPTGPAELLGDGPQGMQGVTVLDSGPVVSVSHGPWVRGSLHGLGASAPARRGALPIGVEDLTRDADGHLWTVAEHPARRAIVRLREPRRRGHPEFAVTPK